MVTKTLQAAPETQAPLQARLQPGAVRPHSFSKNSQAYPGVSPLDAIASRNTIFSRSPATWFTPISLFAHG